MITLEHLPFELDGGTGPGGRVGLVTLASDYTIEAEMHWLMEHAPQLGLFSNRIMNHDTVTPEMLRAMEPLITSTVDEILPGADLDVVAFACTSATMAIGEDRIFERIRASRPKARCTTPITGALAAMKAFGAERIAVLTPYRTDVNEIVANYIGARGLDVAVFGSFNEESDAATGAISPESIRAAIRTLIASVDVDAVFVSCTSLRVASLVAGIEADIGLPVTSSNHAMAWHAMRLAGVTTDISALGRLYTLQADVQPG